MQKRLFEPATSYVTSYTTNKTRVTEKIFKLTPIHASVIVFSLKLLNSVTSVNVLLYLGKFLMSLKVVDLLICEVCVLK